MRTRLGVFTALVLVLAACGGGTTGTEAPTTAAPVTTTTTTAPTTTPTTSPVTTAPPTTMAAGETVTVFFAEPGNDTDTRPGPFLVAVPRLVTEVTPEVAVEALLAGPTADEATADITTAIPESTLNGVTVADGIATVDLSATFDDGGGSASMFARLAQLVWTVTAVPGVDGVRISLDGTPVSVFSSEGIVLDDPMTRTGWDDLLPGILVETPGWGGVVGDDFTITGVAAAFEAVFQLEILGPDGAVVFDVPYVMTDNGTGWGNYSVDVTLGDDVPADMRIHVWENSAKDGSVINERFVPIAFGS